MSVLDQLQAPSFRDDREYCGYIVIDAAGRLRASSATRGASDYCGALIPADLKLVASFHTHGAFDPDVPAEFPSASDMAADKAESINGYVATPGGRLWYIDTEAMQARQICSLGCLMQDPAFRAGQNGKIRNTYGYKDLIRLETGQ